MKKACLSNFMYLKFSEYGSPIAAFFLIGTTHYVIQYLTLLSTITENLKNKEKQ